MKVYVPISEQERFCEVYNECSYCKKVIKISEGNHIATVMYSYYCNRDCYDKNDQVRG